jgi:hypothetical protein
VLCLIQLARVSSSFWWAFMINCAAKPALAYSLIDQLRQDYSVCITIIKHELARSKIKELVLVFFLLRWIFAMWRKKQIHRELIKRGSLGEKYTKFGIFWEKKLRSHQI